MALVLADGKADAMTRRARRKERTRERLLDAALEVFVARGYDGATTTEMARVADLGAGTFYCHFRDKRAAFEGLAHRASRTMMDRWQRAIAPGMSIADGVALGLEVTAAFWREDLARARLLLEGGPSFGNAAHLRLVGDLAETLRRCFASPAGARRRAQRLRALAAVTAGLGIEIGRLIVGGGRANGGTAVREIVALARQAAGGRRR